MGAFVSGIIFGLTGDNHLDELEHCFKDSEPLLKDVGAVLADIKNLQPIAAVQDFGKVIWVLPDSIAECHGIDEDVEEIKEWAQIFKEPVKLTKIVTKNWLTNGEDIKHDIHKEQKYWNKGEYEKAGERTAKILLELVGPMQQNTYSTKNDDSLDDVPPYFAQDLMAGFVYGLTGDNYQDYFRTCYADTPQLEADLSAVVATIEAGGEGNIQKGIEMLSDDYSEIAAAFAPCTDASSDLHRTTTYLKNIKTMSPTKRFNMIIRAWSSPATRDGIKTDWHTLQDDYDALDFFGTGYEALQIFTTVIPESTFQ